MIWLVSPTDLEEIRVLIAAGVRESVARSEDEYAFLIGDIEESLEWWESHRSDSIHRKFVSNGRIAGVIMVKGGWNLTNLFVHPDFYRQGVGTKLLDHVVAECEPISPKKGLRVNSSSFAVPFYERYGFKQTGVPVKRPGGCVPMAFDF